MTRDYAADLRKFLERCGCRVTAEGVATIDDEGKPHLSMWCFETRGHAKMELATMADLKHALLAIAGVDQQAAE